MGCRGGPGMALSAMRSWLFNEYLGERVEAGNWRDVLEGDPALRGVPTGPLFGDGGTSAAGAQGAADECPSLPDQATQSLVFVAEKAGCAGLGGLDGRPSGRVRERPGRQGAGHAGDRPRGHAAQGPQRGPGWAR